MQIEPTPYNIGDLYQWYKDGTLILQPKFQRREVWSKNARSYLIDTIVRGYPIPKLYVRQQIDLDTGKSIREVVDGQQRLKAVFDFIAGELEISKIHNTQYCEQKFEDLPKQLKSDFYSYRLSVDLMLGATDRDVLDIFTRINSYTMTLNNQEKLNATFSGAFKQIVYSLGWDHLEFWRNYGILTDGRIARMGEAELASELVVAMLDGLQNGKESLKSFYFKYDDSFPEANDIKKKFRETIDLVAFIYETKEIPAPFYRVPFFYTLFCVLYDCKYGLPKGGLGLLPVSKKNRDLIKSNIAKLSEEMLSITPKHEFAPLHAAYMRSTDKLNERQIRHTYLWNAIKSSTG
jgi:hypothetical protein